MLHLHFSNRIEVLADDLLSRLAGPRDDVFQADTVVVPHTAARRHLQLELARREGVCAQVAFEYLAHWLWLQVARVQPGVQAESPFDAASLAWRLYALFQDAAFVREHPPLADYLGANREDPVLAYELATAAAAHLEQYITYRPDWLLRWQRQPGARLTSNPHEPWQAAAWSRIVTGLGLDGANPIDAVGRQLEAAGPDAARRFGLPAVVHVFALPAIPPLYLAALQSLARFIDLHVYALNPCREYWFDLVDPRQLDRLEAAGRGEAREVRNTLLSSWGKQAQSALGLLTGIDESERTAWVESYQTSGRGSLLGRLQDAILDLADLAPGSLRPEEGDRSIEVHVAHSLTRELEVLHDRLLDLFAADPTLRPSDILVVTPDLEAAAPLVDAVFGTAPAPRHIPYAMTGRRRSGVNAPVRAFLQLLALAASRCTASEVFDLMQQPVVSARFGLDDEGLQQVHAWIIGAGVHWGLDAPHVAAQQLPSHVAHTFADGLARLFLGYASPGDDPQPFAGYLPRGDAEGSAALPLGAFWRFSTALRELVTCMAQPHTPAAWARLLHQAAEDFILPDRQAMDDWLELQGAIDALVADIRRAGFDGPVAAPVVRAALERALEDRAHGGTPTGRVSFAGMNSLRSLPFRVVCAIGMNHGAFPTPDRPSEFDLMAATPRAGDRQRRTDQRTLFLDLLLSARDVFHLSYAGRSIRDNAPMPASVLVAELLDVLVPATAADPMAADSLRRARAALVVEHPLQPFSPVAFDPGSDRRQRSFDADLAQALRDGLGDAAARVDVVASGDPSGGEVPETADSDDVAEPALRFFPRPLADPGPDSRVVTVRQLVEFFGNPSRYILRRRLGIELLRDEPALEDDEPFVPDFEGRSRLAARLLPELLRGIDAQAARQLARLGTELPPGALGDAELDTELAALRGFAGAVRRETAAPTVRPVQLGVQIDVDGQDWRIHEAFADLRPQGLVRWRYDDERASDILNAWIPHLLLCAALPEGVAPRTTWIARRIATRYDPLPAEEARSRLGSLLALYRDGLTRPVAFFPRSSWAFVQSGKITDARSKFTGSEQFGGERAKPGHALAWRGVPDPLGGDFEAHARTVFADRPVEHEPIVAEDAP